MIVNDTRHQSSLRLYNNITSSPDCLQLYSYPVCASTSSVHHPCASPVCITLVHHTCVCITLVHHPCVCITLVHHPCVCIIQHSTYQLFAFTNTMPHFRICPFIDVDNFRLHYILPVTTDSHTSGKNPLHHSHHMMSINHFKENYR